MTGLVVGPAGLLRLAAVPLDTWLSGGCPELVERLHALELRAAAHGERARAVADDIGTRLVPHPALDRPARAAALRVRRALHAAANPRPADLAELVRLAGQLLPGGDLAAALGEVAAAGAALVADRDAVERLVEAEDERVLAAGWELLHAVASGRRAAAEGNLSVYRDIAARVASGEPWTSKRMRQRADYVWRILTRASTRATPRGWLSHLAPLPVRPDGGWVAGGSLEVLDRAAAQYAPNLDRHRSAATPAGTAALRRDGTLPVALAPLHRLEPQHLVTWTVDGENRDSLGEVRLRRTPALEAVRAHLAGGPRPAGELVELLAGADATRREAATSLLVHLAGRSVLQVCGGAHPVLTGWQPVATAPAADTPAPPRATPRQHAVADDPAEHASDDYVDVYRQPGAGLAAAHAERLAGLVGLALRTLALIDLDAPPEPEPPGGLTGRPRPLLDVVRDRLTEGSGAARPSRHHHDWKPVERPGSPYDRLVGWLRTRLDGTGRVDLDAATLDRLGAPAAQLPWPVDCLLRPLRGPDGLLAALDRIVPAGVYDARFAPALAELGVDLPQVAAYRDFLAQLSQAAGIPLVEVLVPPQSPRAANAVCRPAYTSLWTGDPDRASYIRTGAGSYLPLSRITLRLAQRQVVAEVDGRQVWPVLHTTRTVAPPWDGIVDLLMLASPQPARIGRPTVRYSLPAWPDRDFVPRITVGGALVLTPAQWRLPTARLWPAGARLAAKFARMGQLGRELRLPRLVQVTDDVHHDAVAVDLYSPHGIRALDRMAARGTPTLLLTELLADGLAVRDAASGGATVAELLLRLNATTPVPDLVRQAAAPGSRTHGNDAASRTRRPVALR